MTFDNTRNEDYYNSKREELIAQLKSHGISEDILHAVAQVPRHLFLGEDSIMDFVAYSNKELPLGYGYFIHRPLYSALQVMALKVKPGDVILEMGTGSGYLSALLCVLGAKVYTIEHIPFLYHRAVKLFTQLNYPIQCFAKGEYGFTDFAPFDKIITHLEEKPDIMARRLKIGGFAVYTDGYMLKRIIRHDEYSYPEEMVMDMRVWEEEG